MKEQLRKLFFDMEDIITEAGKIHDLDDRLEYYRNKFWDVTYELDEILDFTLGDK